MWRGTEHTPTKGKAKRPAFCDRQRCEGQVELLGELDRCVVLQRVMQPHRHHGSDAGIEEGRGGCLRVARGNKDELDHRATRADQPLEVIDAHGVPLARVIVTFEEERVLGTLQHTAAGAT